MRVLLGCSLGGRGHLTPLVGVAGSLRRLGHEVVVLLPPALEDAARESGVAYRVGAQPEPSIVDAIWERVRAGPPQDVVGLIDRELFAEQCTRAMLDHALALCAEWRPNVVVREPCEYATAVAASRTRVPQLQVGISQAVIEHAVLDAVSEVVDGFASGLSAEIRASPYLTSFPESLDRSPWPDTRRFRVPAPSPQPLPDWWEGDDRPLLYLTFGTVLGHLPEAGSVFRAALQAVSALPVRVLLTVGHAVDPTALQPAAANTHVEQWVAQHDVYALAQLVVCHGGSGTVFGALAAGLPLVICPLFADQRANAKLVHDAGLGIVHDPAQRPRGALAQLGPADAAPLRAAISSILDHSSYRHRAQQLATEINGTRTIDATLAELLATVAHRGR